MSAILGGKGSGRGRKEKKEAHSTERRRVRHAFYLKVPNKTKKE